MIFPGQTPDGAAELRRASYLRPVPAADLSFPGHGKINMAERGVAGLSRSFQDEPVGEFRGGGGRKGGLNGARRCGHNRPV